VRLRVKGGRGVETTQQREHIQYERSLCEWAGGWVGGRVVEWVGGGMVSGWVHD